MTTFGTNVSYENNNKSSNTFSYIGATLALLLAGVSLAFSILKILQEETDSGGDNGGGGGTFPSVVASDVTIKNSLKTPRLTTPATYDSNIYDLVIQKDNAQYNGLRSTFASDITITGGFKSVDGDVEIFNVDNFNFNVKNVKSNLTTVERVDTNYQNSGAQRVEITRTVSTTQQHNVKIVLFKQQNIIIYRLENQDEQPLTVYNTPSLFYLFTNVTASNNAILIVNVTIELDGSITTTDIHLLNGLKITVIPYSNTNWINVKFVFKVVSTFLFRAQGRYTLLVRGNRNEALRNLLTNNLIITPDINSEFYKSNYNFAYGTLNLIFLNDKESLSRDELYIIFYNKNSF